MTAPNLSRAADAGPIIVLAKVGRLDVLTAGGRSVFVTDTVAREVEAGRAGDPARYALQSGWGTRLADVLLPEDLAAWKLDAGEQSVLALARHIGAVAVLHDGAVRKVARALAIPHTGTIGLVIEAKRQELVTSAVDLLRNLRPRAISARRRNITGRSANGRGRMALMKNSLIFMHSGGDLHESCR